MVIGLRCRWAEGGATWVAGEDVLRPTEDDGGLVLLLVI